MMQRMKTKFRKAFKDASAGAAKAVLAEFGEFGLKRWNPSASPRRQIEAARRALTRHMSAPVVWIRVFPDVPVSKKPIESAHVARQGAPEFWIARVRAAASCSRSDACRSRWRARPSRSPPPNCRSRRASSRASPSKRER